MCGSATVGVVLPVGRRTLDRHGSRSELALFFSIITLLRQPTLLEQLLSIYQVVHALEILWQGQNLEKVDASEFSK
jgi:hypothetical protein